MSKKRVFHIFPLLLSIIVSCGCGGGIEYVAQPTVTLQPVPSRQPPVPVHQPLQLKRPSGIYHTVTKGETLWRIGQLYGVTVADIVQANRMPDPTYIESGQKLFIPTDAAFSRLKTSPKKMQHVSRETAFIWPIKGNILYGFGMMVDGAHNKGIDIKSKSGAAIKAAKSGYVSFAAEDVKGMGTMIILDHHDNFQTVYAHNSKNTVSQGDYVKQGQVIAYVGTTGRAHTASLHFEIRKNSEPHNPRLYLP